MSNSSVSLEDNRKNEFYISDMQKFRDRSEKVDELTKGRFTYFSSKESRDKEWWNSCQTYTAIAVFAIFMLACVVVATLAASRILI